MKVGKDGKICAIDDRIKTEEEVDKMLKDVSPELREKWRKEFFEYLKRKGEIKSEE